MRKREYLRVFGVGGLGYGAIELIWRGRTHWSMLMAGGLSFGLIYRISGTRRRLPLKALMSCCAVTAVEFLFGVVFNLLLGQKVWDYSDRPGHLLGQICPLYSLFWLILSLPCLKLAGAMRRL